jgi:endoglucanase
MFSQSVLPRWQGFNLNHRIRQQGGAFEEADFAMISELGFNYVRLPLNYKQWIADGNWNRIDERKLEGVDEAVRWGEAYGLHVNLCFHRGPGYSASSAGHEPYRLFQDEEALQAFILHWVTFARRYRGIGDRLSFNLLNEPRSIPGRPVGVGHAEHAIVMRTTIGAIREVDSQRLILLDGLDAGQVPPTDLFDLAKDRVAANMRVYQPGGVTHYGADWDGNERYDHIPPAWPGGVSLDGVWDRERLGAFMDVWSAFSHASGMGLHCGESGCYNRTPHAIALSWLEDVLALLTERNVGLALWNFRGEFGILDSGRKDVDYESWHGHLLDRRMYELLKAYR